MKARKLACADVWLLVGPLIMAIGLFGCATYSWKPGPTAIGSYEEASGKCSMMAKSGSTGFYAQGTPGYVAGAAVGAAIGEAARQQNSFNDCMRASGWISGPADKETIEANRTESRQLISKIKACVASVRNSPKYASFSAHFGDPASGHYTLAQMADTSRVSKADIPLLSTYADEKAKCVESRMEEIAKLDPRAAVRFKRMEAAMTDLNLELLTAKITWGEYSQQAQHLAETVSTGKTMEREPDSMQAK